MFAVNLKFLTAAALFICLMLSIHLYQSDMMAKEAGVPQKLITVLIMAAVIMTMWLTLPKNHCIIITLFCVFFAVGFLLLLIPFFYTRSEWIAGALGHLTGPFFGGAFYFTLLQYRRSRGFNLLWLYALLCAVAVEAVAILLLLFPNSMVEGVSYGSVARRANIIFQWPAAMSGFLAAGLILTLVLLVLPGFRLQTRAREQWRSLLLALLLVVLSVTLVWGPSRTVWPGVVLSVGLFVWLFVRKYPLRCLLALILIALSACSAILVEELKAGMHYLSAGSINNTQGILQLDMLAMITEKRWFGWGYGGIEYGFQAFRFQPLPLSVLTTLEHNPGNEILLWCVEGGLTALWGLSLLLLGVVLQIRQALQRDFIAYRRRAKTAGEATGLCLVLLVLFLNARTAYPFYISIAYWAIFFSLLAMLALRGRSDEAMPGASAVGLQE